MEREGVSVSERRESVRKKGLLHFDSSDRVSVLCGSSEYMILMTSRPDGNTMREGRKERGEKRKEKRERKKEREKKRRGRRKGELVIGFADAVLECEEE
jgi:hypothetical protein